MRMMPHHGYTASLALILLSFVACRGPVKPAEPDYLDDGWMLFGEQNYQAAIEQFGFAVEEDPDLADGWNGLGWAFGKLDQAPSSETSFSQGISLGVSSIVGTELLAGRSFARLARGDFSGVIDDADAALARSGRWVFSRDVNIGYKQLILNTAVAYFSLADFAASLSRVQQLDSGFNADVTTLPGRAQLAAKLEALQAGL